MTREQAEQLGARALWVLISVATGAIDLRNVQPAELLGGTNRCRLARAILKGDAIP